MYNNVKYKKGLIYERIFRKLREYQWYGCHIYTICCWGSITNSIRFVINQNIQREEKMKYKINIKNGGGEYTFGAVTNEEDIAAIHTAIENDEVANWIETDDGEINHFDLDDMLLQTYGPDVQAANILVASFPSDTDDSDVDYDDGEVIIDDNIDETDVPVFTNRA